MIGISIIDEIGEMALSTRLVRLSELIRKDITQMYMENGLDFESKWFPVLYVLMKKSPIGIIELADEIGYAHPSVIALVKEMENKKIIKSVASKTDGRKRMLSLTPTGTALIKDLEPLWENILKVAKKISDNKNNLLLAIEETEAVLKEESFYSRCNKLELKRNAKRK
jgi:DNA-binding MarR family transcriptional regulator